MARSRISFLNQSNVDEPTVNLTPLIDVVFVILIMFIVIAPLLEMDRIELANGPAVAVEGVQSVKEQSAVSLQVFADNTIQLNGRLVAPGELPHQLKQAKEEFPTAIPQVFHDRRAHFGIYQDLKNAVEEAGFPQMEIILKPA